MNRRSTAIVTAFFLLLALGATSLLTTVPYVRFKPGLTIDLLRHEPGERPIVQVSGHPTYKTTGQLRMTTVSSTGVGRYLPLWDALATWAAPDSDLYPYRAIYPPESTREEERNESQIEMVSSQDHAIAAALVELGFRLKPRPAVLRTIPGSAAAGKLQAHDVILRINGDPMATSDSVAKTVSSLSPGETAKVEVLRKGRQRTFDLTTKPSESDPEKAAIGIFLGSGYDFPFEVSVNIPDQIGGPSAGLVFSLAIYDTLTRGSMTGGAKIAGTGTIDEAGSVGPIGGIRQKIAGAEADGAELFLVPPANCDEAVLADTDLILVRADTMHSAVESIQAYAKDKKAPLPGCSQEGER